MITPNSQLPSALKVVANSHSIV